MRVEQKTHVKNGLTRMAFVAVSVLSQILWFLVLVMKLSTQATWISALASLIALVFALRMFYRKTTGTIKMAWIIVILVFPVFGIALYLLLGRPDGTKKKRKIFAAIATRMEEFIPQKETVFDAIEMQDKMVANQLRYLKDYGKYPTYENCDVEYYKDATEGLSAQIAALKEAKHYIFMEYHAIEQESAFDELYEVLKERAKAGVEVRILYDDIGSSWFISPEFVRRVEADGIACRIFNPIRPAVLLFMNNRDHRKITVIDGKVAFTGGYNLAEEYFNRTHPYGYWKDTGIKVSGAAAKSFVVMFLEMWNFVKHTDTDYTQYIECEGNQLEEKLDGFVTPYADNPLDFERVGENVYLNLIKGAKQYVYFVTPYLILTDEMIRELTLAAKRGVDVRIVTPGVPDKKLTYQVTRSFYAPLVDEGVKVYEYTPGFCHAKMCITDDELATVGTINLDYRSLYHHFENGCLLYKKSAVLDIRADFDDMFVKSKNVTEDYKTKQNHMIRIGQCLLRLIAPLL